jgi:hypothetical protein
MKLTVRHEYRPMLLFIVAVLLLTMAVQAQKKAIPPRVKILKDSLQLSDEQVDKITKILENQRTEMIATMNIIEREKKSPEATRALVQGFKKKSNEKLMEVLTKDQRQKFEAMVKAEHEKREKQKRGSDKH